MAKIIVIRLTKAGKRANTFSLTDSLGNVLATNVSKQDIIDGLSFEVPDSVVFVTITPINKGCCNVSVRFPIREITNEELVTLEFNTKNQSSTWKHLANTQIYNKYYGCEYPYIIEYPFTYQFHDEILQSVKDFTKAYVYLSPVRGISDDTRKIQTDDRYFNKAIIYNDQQSTGLLTLAPKPLNNMKEYMKYPIYSTDTKTVLFTKNDNFYQYNTFWNVVKNKTETLFITSCESMSVDKELNQANMDYSSRVFKKQPIRGKDVKIRHILDNSCETHLVSQFILIDSQISYK